MLRALLRAEEYFSAARLHGRRGQRGLRSLVLSAGRREADEDVSAVLKASSRTEIKFEIWGTLITVKICLGSQFIVFN